METVKGFPPMRYYWPHSDFNALVMQRLGESLEACHRRLKHRFSIITVIKIAIQTLERIEAFHRKGYVWFFTIHLV